MLPETCSGFSDVHAPVTELCLLTRLTTYRLHMSRVVLYSTLYRRIAQHDFDLESKGNDVSLMDEVALEVAAPLFVTNTTTTHSTPLELSIVADHHLHTSNMIFG